MRTREVFRKVISLILVLVLILPVFNITVYAEEKNEINIEYKPYPDIDVILAKGETKVELETFKDDLLEELRMQGIDTDKVKISTISNQIFNSNQEDAQTIFSTWQKIGRPGDWSYNEEGKYIVNAENSDDITGFYDPQNFNYRYIDLSYDFMTENGDDDWVGAILKFNKDENGNVTSYVFLISNGEKPWNSEEVDSIGGLYKIVEKPIYSEGSVRTYTNFETLKVIDNKWTRNEWQTHRIVVDNNNIKVYIKGELVIDYTDNSETAIQTGTYGFISWSQPDSRFKNIVAKTIEQKKMNEVLKETKWRQDALKVLVNVEDRSRVELDNPATLAQTAVRMTNEQINYIAWGTDNNKEQSRKIINANNSNGIYTDNTEYEQAIKDTASYIKDLMKNQQTNNQYVISNEKVLLNITPEEIKNNTKTEDYPNGKWVANHEYNYFENGNGQYSQTGNYTDSVITDFSKVGKYTLAYVNGEINPSEIYSHRRPVALFDIEREKIDGVENIQLINKSFDIDKFSRNNGIQEEKWQYKKIDETEWTEGKLSKINEGETYIIKLEVKDYQNTWSYPETKFVTTLSALPVSEFKIMNPEITVYEELDIKDASYDPTGGKITGKEWKVYKDDNLIYTGAEPLVDYKARGAGNYKISLVVTNEEGIRSEEYIKEFKVTEDKMPPEIIITKGLDNKTSNEQVDVEFNIVDFGGSGVKHYKYAVTSSSEAPSIWSPNVGQTTGKIKLEEEGKYYIHLIATDNDGNTSEDRIVGEFIIDKTPPILVVEGNQQDKVIDELTLDINGTDNLSGIETIKIGDKEITQGQYRFTKNGDYTIVLEDNAGNVKTETITISNIFKECNKGLEHPEYDSLLDKCPICALEEQVDIKSNEVIYNGKPQGLDYTVPEGVEIIEYYNESTEKPKDAGDYPYELRIMYNGEEHKTDIKGTFTIKAKELTIQGLNAEDKKYDGKKEVKIKGGTLLGIEDGDEVSPKVPEKGTALQENIGRWPVQINEITLTGKDAKNYTVKQPGISEINVQISQADGILEIKCDSKKYDGKPIVPQIVNKNSSADVTFKYFISGTDQGVEKIYDIGKYDVVATMPADKNYTGATSNKVTFEITKAEEPNLKIEAKISKINNLDVQKKVSSLQEVKYNDKVIIDLTVGNIGKGSGFANKLLANLPEGIELDKNSSINKENGWEILEDGKIVTKKLAKDENNKNEIIPGNEENMFISNCQIELLVTATKPKETILANVFKVEQADKRGDIVNYSEENKKNGEAKIQLQLKYFDIQLEKTISTVVRENLKTKETETIDVGQKVGQLSKIEISKKKIRNSILKINYEIKVTNLGNEAGKIQAIKDIYPSNLTFDSVNNTGWKETGVGTLQYDMENIELKPQESKVIKLQLELNLASNNLGQIKNMIEPIADTDIDTLSKKDNNKSYSEIIVGIKTGSWQDYKLLTLSVFVILGLGIYSIKRYVLK